MNPCRLHRYLRIVFLYASVVCFFLLLSGLFADNMPHLSAADTKTNPIYLPLIRSSYAPDNRSSDILDTATLTATVSPTATLTASPTTLERLNATGIVYLRTRYESRLDSNRPIEFVIVLDVSGSMEWNFAGQGGRVRNPKQCTYNPDHDVPLTSCGNAYPWTVIEERRIYSAKQAIFTFIDEMNENDAMTIVGYTSDDYPIAAEGTRQLGTTAGKAELVKFVKKAGAGTLRNPYQARGGTPSASGLRAARELLAAAPDEAPNGEDYRQVVIFMTDGVANYLVEPAPDVYRERWDWLGWAYSSALDNPGCNTTSGPTNEAANCMTGYIVDNDGNVTDIPRPITAMALEGEALQADGTTVYAMMMGQANVLGLSDVASGTTYPFFTRANEGYMVSDILDDINTDVRSVVRPGTCVPVVGPWIAHIDDEHAPAPDAEHPELGSTAFGYATLYDQYGVKQGESLITHDPTTGQLTYTINDLVPGVYILDVELYYKGDDGITRKYDVIYDRNGNLATAETRTVIVSESGALNNQVVAPQLYLDISSNLCESN